MLNLIFFGSRCSSKRWENTAVRHAYFSISGESSYEGENMTEERKQREQLLELNHLIARQVMEKSRMVAGTNFIKNFN